ncbi:MAG: thiamine diphosphokinase [Coprococcus sp.]
MTYLIVTGGLVKEQVIDSTLSIYDFDYIIAVDKGIEVCHRADIKPNLIIGDFDSANRSIVQRYKEDCDVITLNPHKDDTDTEAALIYAIEHEASQIIILGATGSRYDHAMANIGLLKKCTDRNIKAYIIDDHNRISMINKDTRVNKSEYTYISLLPYGGDVCHVALSGFEYDGDDICFELGTSLGISNSIISDYGDISFQNGYLILYETKD